MCKSVHRSIALLLIFGLVGDPVLASVQAGLPVVVHPQRVSAELFTQQAVVQALDVGFRWNKGFDRKGNVMVAHFAGMQALVHPLRGAGQHVIGREGLLPDEAKRMAERLEARPQGAPGSVREVSAEELNDIASYIQDLRNPRRNNRAKFILEHFGQDLWGRLYDVEKFLHSSASPFPLGDRDYRVVIKSIQGDDPLRFENKMTWGFHVIDEDLGQITLYVPELDDYRIHPNKLDGLIHDVLEYLVFPQDPSIRPEQRHDLAFVLEAVAGGEFVDQNRNRLLVPRRFFRELDRIPSQPGTVGQADLLRDRERFYEARRDIHKKFNLLPHVNSKVTSYLELMAGYFLDEATRYVTRQRKDPSQGGSGTPPAPAGMVSGLPPAEDFNGFNAERQKMQSLLDDMLLHNPPQEGRPQPMVQAVEEYIRQLETKMREQVRGAGAFEQKLLFRETYEALKAQFEKGLRPAAWADVSRRKRIEKDFVDRHRRAGVVLVGKEWEKWDEDKHVMPLLELFRAVAEEMHATMAAQFAALSGPPDVMFWFELAERVHAAGAAVHVERNERGYQHGGVVGMVLSDGEELPGTDYQASFEEVYDYFGAVGDRLRLEMGDLTPRELSRMIFEKTQRKVSRETLYSILKGIEGPGLGTFIAISRTLKIPLLDLLHPHPEHPRSRYVQKREPTPPSIVQALEILQSSKKISTATWSKRLGLKDPGSVRLYLRRMKINAGMMLLYRLLKGLGATHDELAEVHARLLRSSNETPPEGLEWSQASHERHRAKMWVATVVLLVATWAAFAGVPPGRLQVLFGLPFFTLASVSGFLAKMASFDIHYYGNFIMAVSPRNKTRPTEWVALPGHRTLWTAEEVVAYLLPREQMSRQRMRPYFEVSVRIVFEELRHHEGYGDFAAKLLAVWDTSRWLRAHQYGRVEEWKESLRALIQKTLGPQASPIVPELESEPRPLRNNVHPFPNRRIHRSA